jgi:predicted TIM-barrel fold metal-dependent hydrolase
MTGKIALEEHFITPELEELMFPSIGWDPAEWQEMRRRLNETGDVRLAEMDRFGIERSVLSLAAPCIQDEVDPARAVTRAAAANDRLAEVVARRPDRFSAFAALPMQDPDAAAGELERTVRDYGFKGALVNGYSSIGSLDTAAYYDEPRFLPFWERVAALGVPFYLHPRNPLPNQRRIYQGREELLGPTWAFAVETGTHAMRLITSGLFDRFPTLTIVLGHLGEFLPFAVDRLQQRLSHIPSVALRRRPVDVLRENFYVTTSGNFHTPSLVAVLTQLGADRVLFAVDYPFERAEDAVSWFDTVAIGDDDRQKIGRTNAQRLLGLRSA